MATHHRAPFVVRHQDVIEDGVVTVDAGRITAVEPFSAERHPDPIHHRDAALLPGLVNAHSHAFQRALRGRAEHLTAGRDDFWSWRTVMYAMANALTPEQLEAVSAMAFLEMARAGVTTVGEFHYLHHQPDGTAYDDPNTLSHRVISAARRVGLRITLLRVAYGRAGFRRAPDPLQRRFVESDVYRYLGRVTALDAAWRHEPRVQVGLAPHSVRAVSGKWLWAISEHQGIMKMPVHIHACEQRAELEACKAEYGRQPVEVIADEGLLGPRVSLVHATHLDRRALDLIYEHRPTIVACPLTEANLGDGVLPAADLLERGASIAIGSDGQSRIDPWAELSQIENNLRLRHECRNVLARYAGPRDDRRHTADVLWPMAAENGARSLGLDCGVLGRGHPADMIALDLRDPALAGTTAETLLADLTLGMTPRAVKSVWVDGEPIVRDGRHADEDAIVDGYRAAMKAVEAAL